MPKYCKSCGKEFKGEFCEHCGYGNPNIEIKATKKYETKIPERFLEEQKKDIEKNTDTKKSNTKVVNKKKQQLVFLVVLLVVVAGIVLFALYKNGVIFKSRTPEKVTTQYFTAISDMDYDMYIDCMTDGYIDSFNDGLENKNIEKADAIKELYKDYVEEFGEGFKTTVSFGRISSIGNAEIDTFEEDYESQYGDNINISDAKCVRTEVIYKGDKKTTTTYYNVYVGKVGRDYCIMNVEDDTSQEQALKDTTTATKKQGE